jgi:hypothetical protein
MYYMVPIIVMLPGLRFRVAQSQGCQDLDFQGGTKSSVARIYLKSVPRTKLPRLFMLIPKEVLPGSRFCQAARIKILMSVPRTVLPESWLMPDWALNLGLNSGLESFGFHPVGQLLGYLRQHSLQPNNLLYKIRHIQSETQYNLMPL